MTGVQTCALPISFTGVGALSGVIDGLGDTDSADYSGANAGFRTISLANLASIETVTGGGSGWTLTGGSTWLIGNGVGDGSNDGTVDTTISFVNWSDLTGTTGVDTFTISGGVITGAVDGAGDSDTLAGSTSYIVNNLNQGLVSGASGGFSNIENLTGTAGVDTFTLDGGSLSGAIDGLGNTDKLAGSTTYTVTGANQGTATGVTAGFSNIETLEGTTGNDTFAFGTSGTLSGGINGLAGSDTIAGQTTFAINSGNGGTTEDLTGMFSGIENLTGTTGNDTFTFGVAGTLAGNITGLGGSDTIAGQSTFSITGADAGTSENITGTFTGVESLTGTSGNDTFAFGSSGSLGGNIVGLGGADTIEGQSTYTITAANSGSSEDLTGTFTGIENLTGTTGVDTFTFSGTGTLTGTIDGLGDNDSADYSAADAGFRTISLAQLNSIETVTGGGAGWTLSGGSTWLIGNGVGDGSNDGTVDTTISFIDWANLTGTAGADTFEISSGVITGAVDGVAGSDTLEGSTTYVIAAANQGTATGIGGGFSNIENLTGTTGADTFTLSGGSLLGAIDGEGGSDTLAGSSSYTVNGLNQGLVSGASGGFSNIENLTGTAGVDTFTLDGGSLSGAIDGLGNTDKLAGSTTYTVTGANQGTATGVTAGFSNIETLEGTTANDTFTFDTSGTLSGGINGLAGSDTIAGQTTFAINSGNGGTTEDLTGMFSGIENLTGTTGNDTFTFGVAGTLAGNITGLGGSDTIAGQSTFSITGADAGTSENITGTFTGVESLTGTSGNDTFAFGNSGSLGGNIVGLGGTDTIEGQSTYTITAANSGSSEDLTGTFTGIENLTGTTGVDTFTFSGTGTLTGTIDGLGDNDSADYSAADAGFRTISLAQLNSIETVTGGGAGWTLSGGSTWLIGNGVGDGSNDGTVDTTISFIDWANLTGTAGADTFEISSGVITGAVDGVAGSDTLEGSTTYVIAAANQGTATGIGGGFSNIENLTGTTGADTFTLSGGSLLGAIDGEGGSDTLAGSSSYTVNGLNQGLVSGASGGFSNIENLTGTAGVDTFTLDGGSLSGAIDGLGNTDKLAGSTTYTVTGANQGTATGVTAGFSNIETLEGTTGNDTFAFGTSGTLSGGINGLAGSDTIAGQTTFAINSGNGGTTEDLTGMFSGIENLTGTTGNDTFTFGVAGTLAGNITGLGGVDTIAGQSTFSITGANEGSSENITGTFTGVESLTGTSGNDTFAFGNSGSLGGNIVGLGGTDTIEGQSTYTITAANSGSSEDLTGTFTGIENLTGTTGVDTFTFSGTGTLTGTIDGLGDNDSADYSAADAGFRTISLAQLNSIETVTGGGAGWTLSGGSTWLIGNGVGDGSNDGTVDTAISFIDWANLTGTAGADTFVFDGGKVTGGIEAGGGFDRFRVEGSDAAQYDFDSGGNARIDGVDINGFEEFVAGNGNDTFTVSEGISFAGILNAGGGADSLVFNGDNSRWTVAGSAIDLNGVSFTGIESLTDSAKVSTTVTTAEAVTLSTTLIGFGAVDMTLATSVVLNVSAGQMSVGELSRSSPITLTSSAGITGGKITAPLLIVNAVGDVDLQTAVERVNIVTSGGGVKLVEDGNIVLERILAQGKGAAIDVKANNNIVVGRVSTGDRCNGSIRLESKTENIRVLSASFDPSLPSVQAGEITLIAKQGDIGNRQQVEPVVLDSCGVAFLEGKGVTFSALEGTPQPEVKSANVQFLLPPAPPVPPAAPIEGGAQGDPNMQMDMNDSNSCNGDDEECGSGLGGRAYAAIFGDFRLYGSTSDGAVRLPEGQRQ